MNITLDQVESLAPDSGTLNRAKKIAKPGNYDQPSGNDRALWGDALGSSHYRTMIDFSGPAYKCSCPVNRMPCKHAMGLMVLAAQQPEAINQQEPPEDVATWLAKRDATQKAKASKQSGEVKDPKAQARRAEQRAKNVDKGLNELKRFLEDTIRIGLAESAKRTDDVWDQMQKRLVDAQARGLSRYLDWIRQEMGQGANWTDRVFRALVRLHALVAAYENRDQLPKAFVEDVRERIGWAKSKEAILQEAPVAGPWFVLNQGIKYESGLYTQSIWLMQQTTGQFALVLNFGNDFSREALQGGYQNGALMPGNAFYYSQWSPQRALLERQSAFDFTAVDDWQWFFQQGHNNIAKGIEHLQKQRIQNPLQETWPLIIHKLRLVTKEGQTALADEAGRLLLIDRDFPRIWQLMACMGNETASLFMVTHDGIHVQPWGLLTEQGQWLTLNMNQDDEE